MHVEGNEFRLRQEGLSFSAAGLLIIQYIRVRVLGDDGDITPCIHPGDHRHHSCRVRAHVHRQRPSASFKTRTAVFFSSFITLLLVVIVLQHR